MGSIFKPGPGVATILIAGLLAAGFAVSPSIAEKAQVVPAPSADESAGRSSPEVAVLAGGCFWGVQGVFQHVDGVKSAVSGYAGGAADTAHYDRTTRGDTGHAESVKITYDPARVSYGKLLQVFFSVAHDPTELNYQGPDRGTQYRSAIFPQNDEQARLAKAYIAQLDAAHVYGAPVVTTIEPGKAFYRAENYHQDYLTHNPDQPYIAYYDMPKIKNLEQLFPSLFRPDPVLVGAGS
jgi:peptide-methionine (S)-S-oxide reductase